MNYTLNIKGRLLSLEQPQVMGILNCTPDSFFAGSRKQSEKDIAERVHQIVAEGGTIIDVGAFSTRPGAQEVSEEEEMERLRRALPVVRREQPDVAVSVDTYRPDVARMVVISSMMFLKEEKRALLIRRSSLHKAKCLPYLR